MALAALANAILLFVVAAYILFEAAQRFRDPPEVLFTPCSRSPRTYSDPSSPPSLSSPPSGPTPTHSSAPPSASSSPPLLDARS
jgi:hypothetical protein